MAARKTLPVTLKRKSVRTRNLRKILIVCEGKKTEPSYFRAFPDNPEVFDVLDIQGMGANTLSLVRKAIELKELAEDRGEPYIEVWVVFDRDEFPLQHFKEAIRLASANNIFCAYSIESFELWFLLHFNYSDSQLSRSDYCDKLSKFMGMPYQKNDTEMYSRLKSRMNTAIRNASKLYAKNAVKPLEQQNPITLVHRLVQRLS